MNNVKPHSIRISVRYWIDQNNFDTLLSLLQKYPCGIERVSLLDNDVHTPIELEEMERRAVILKDRIEQLTAAGFKGGINVIATIGHHPDFNEYRLKGDYYHMTDAMGNSNPGTYCLNDDRYLNDYLSPLYKILASTNPEHIWIDDDVRYTHMPIGLGCYCDCCIASFNALYAAAYTRDNLREELNAGNLELRRKWHSFSSKRISKILRLIGESVRAVDDGIRLGFMTGERPFEGYDFDHWAQALSDNGRYEIMWRPGGGAYSDYNFDDIIQKSEEIGRQNVNLPSYVTTIYSELENCPNHLTNKTPTSTALEVAIMMTTGCTGTALNVITNPIADTERYFRAIDRKMSFHTILAQKTARRQPSGICAGWRKDDIVGTKNPHWSQNGRINYSFASQLFDIGLPQCYDLANSSVRLIAGSSSDAWTDEEIIDVLKGNVYLDATALSSMSKRGVGNLIGVTCGKTLNGLEAMEIFSDHEINAGFVGKKHSGYFMNDPEAYELIPVGEGTEILSSLSISKQTVANCSLSLLENRLGGRVAVAGFDPFSHVGDRYKSTQLKRLFLRLSGNTLPSYVETPCRLRNHTFVDGERITIALINPTNENLTDIRIAIKTEKEQASLWHEDCLETIIETQKGENGYSFMNIDVIPAYEIVLIEL